MTKHDELLKLLKPLMEFMDENGFSYFLVAGKDGTCARYMDGEDVPEMLEKMSADFDQVKNIFVKIAKK